MNPQNDKSREPRKRVRIIGGVAGGSSCATRLRRLDENADIVVYERGPHVSFANCGLPYHVGDVIRKEKDLLLVTPERFKERFEIDVKIRTEVISVDPKAKTIQVRDLGSGDVTEEPYDALVLATGAASLRPPIPGLDLPGVFTLRTVPDTRHIRAWIDEHHAKSAVVVGAGFVGLELAENLVGRGIDVHILELQPQVLPPLDPEMADHVAEHLREHGVHLHLGQGLSRVEQHGDRLRLTTQEMTLDADIVILGIGVRPRVALAREAGLEIGPTGGIKVDETLRTSDPHIWAVGDVIEDRSAITGDPIFLPLAGPANRQGRMAADAICGRLVNFRGVQGTAVCGVFDLTVATTGLSEKALARAGVEDVHVTWLHPKNHVGYYPGATDIHVKLLYREDGRILGAQAIGQGEGVARRIDVISMAAQLGGTVYDLEQAELCYAPQYGAAKDPVNMAGMIAANELRGDLPVANWSDLADSDALLVDVRSAREFSGGHIPGALNIPLDDLRDRIDEIPTDREVWLYCLSGKRSYDAARALVQLGVQAKTLPGGIESWRHMR